MLQSKFPTRGIVEHFKGGKYEIIDLALLERDAKTIMCVYKSLEDGRLWVRPFSDFHDFVTVGIDVHERYKQVSTLDSPVALFAQTLRSNYRFFFDQQDHSPTFISGGGFNSLKYTVGDKISFAMCIRLITRQQAQALLKWVNGWGASSVKPRYMDVVTSTFKFEEGDVKVLADDFEKWHNGLDANECFPYLSQKLRDKINLIDRTLGR